MRKGLLEPYYKGNGGRESKEEWTGWEGGIVGLLIGGKAAQRDERLEAGSPLSFYGFGKQKKAKKMKAQLPEGVKTKKVPKRCLFGSSLK